LQVNSADAPTVTPEGEVQSGPTAAEPSLQVNSADAPTVTSEGEVQSGPTAAEPSLPFNFEGVMEDVMTVTPRGGFQNQLTEASAQ
jgi:hypothetical protein